METKNIWNNFNDELYFFILKKVKNENDTKDIFQNTFLKIHKNLTKLKNNEKVKAWVFQIARNEIINHFNKESVYVKEVNTNKETPQNIYQDVCCFDRFITDLPKINRDVIELVYIKGLKQKEVANTLDISLENVKVRIKRSKEILKNNFKACCKYDLDKNGNLTGEPNCSVCNRV
ncbi:sigma-70 family RNA polymerase sigma factor [Algibacter sp. L1A34]|uniref:sigma-70 family RNA polymerase sigma factor n=1 Tax=Algibacter sp. L1A34 TaxID=2686365 RepID=UPI00131D9129|nr:sigma-70 family RNA polymerase sigma factor [Algibacter sp. L1A34]